MKKLFNKNLIKKNIIAVVALIEIIMISAVSVFAWTETISSLKILTQNEGVVDSGINNTANINAADTAINLDSYFSESGNVHLASCSSPDGKDFYFPVKARAGSSTQRYRKGNLNDRNANYISFSLKIKAESADRTFYFRQAPTIKINDQTLENTDNSVRMAFFLDNNSKGIFANSTANADSVNSISGDTTTVSVKSFSDYSIGKTKIFTVNANNTATLTVSLWLEDPSCTKASGTVSVDGLELITNSQKTTRFTFVDRTSAHNDQNDKTVNTWRWVENDNAVMWISDGTKSYKMSKNGESDEWIVNINANSYTTSTNLTFYRTKDTVTDPVADASDKTKVFNKWTAKYQTNKTTYTAYGASYDTSGNCRGTWDEVTEITLNAENTATAKAVLPIPATTATNTAAHIKLLYRENSTDISVEMSYHEGMWRCYIPSSVTKLGFAGVAADGADTGTLNQTSTSLDRKAETAYTVTSQNTGYWGTGVLVKASVDSSCAAYGTATVKQGGNEVNGYRVTQGSSVEFVATANSGYQFKQWTAGSVTRTSSSVTVTANSDLNYVAYFVKEFTLTANASTGGTVKLKSGGTAGATAQYKAAKGSVITISDVFTATADSHYKFVGWYDSATGGNSLTQVTLDDNTDVYARFTLVNYTVTVHSTTGGTVQTASGGTAGTTAEYSAPYGTTVTLSDVFTATANSNYIFDGWYDAETDGNKIDNVTLSGNTDVYARFTKLRKVYLTNNYNWEKLYCYACNSSTGSKNADFPGIEMTYDSQNGYNQSVYVIEVPYTYDTVVFSNGTESTKTNEVSIQNAGDEVKYYISGGSGGNHTVSTW